MTIDFAVGRTNPEDFPVKAFKAAAARAIDNEYEALSNYHGGLGHPRLREILAARESDREGVAVNPDHLTLMNGSMQGVTVVADALITHNDDHVLVEEFCYPGTLAAYRSLGIQMHGVTMDEEGMRPASLEDHLDRLANDGIKPRFIYTTATYQNPTGAVMSRERKLQVIDIVQRHECILVEDNCYGDVHYDGEKAPAFYALEEHERHIYICSLSKIFAPGVRLGYVYAQPSVLARVLAKRNDAGSNYFAAAVLAEYFGDSVWPHTEAANVSLKRKRDIVVESLAEYADTLCVWSHPPGGLFVWVRYPDDVDNEKLERLAAERDVRYGLGRNFHFAGAQCSYLRIAFGHVPDADIREGIRRLAQCIGEARTSNEAVGLHLFDA
ncbi:MAG: PLP-dependent aminotransferase family protein [Gammaproteobacteria bacterium]|nr:MAG: PLP-dependent aminotransferase family protein [Gammaproteobacteria bacterium]